MTADLQERRHQENQQALDQLQHKLDLLIQQNETQSLALRMIVGGSIADTDVLLKFRDEHQRFMRYDRRITEAAENIASWVTRLLIVGSIVIVVWGIAATGIFDSIRALILRQ